LEPSTHTPRARSSEKNTAPAISQSMLGRHLFNAAYVAGGCVGAPPPLSGVDDSVGTYVTNYAIGVAGLVAALVLFCKGPDHVLPAGFFLGTGAGFAIAGVVHQTALSEEELDAPLIQRVPSLLAGASLILGNLFLGALGMALVAPKVHSLALRVARVLFGTVILVVVAAGVTVAGVTAQLAIGGGLLFFTHATLMVIWLRLARARMGSAHMDSASGHGAAVPMLKATAMLICILGFASQLLLSSRCGVAGYAECWSRCPLPAPAVNHNGLFHALYLIGILLLLIGCIGETDVSHNLLLAALV
jgi:hypothetical protein